jgi:hypothetical protein
MQQDRELDEFLAFIHSRGIPEKYRSLYRSEVLAIKLNNGVARLSQLDRAVLVGAIKEAEDKLKNVKAVCTALASFLQYRDSLRPQAQKKSAPPPADAESDHRRYVRVPFTSEVSVDGILSGARCSDLSVGGMYLETVQPFAADAVMRLSFKLEPGGRVLEMKGRVVYSDPGVGCGIDFSDAPRDVRAAIHRHIQKVVAGEAP